MIYYRSCSRPPHTNPGTKQYSLNRGFKVVVELSAYRRLLDDNDDNDTLVGLGSSELIDGTPTNKLERRYVKITQTSAFTQILIACLVCSFLPACIFLQAAPHFQPERLGIEDVRTVSAKKAILALWLNHPINIAFIDSIRAPLTRECTFYKHFQIGPNPVPGPDHPKRPEMWIVAIPPGSYLITDTLIFNNQTYPYLPSIQSFGFTVHAADRVILGTFTYKGRTTNGGAKSILSQESHALTDKGFNLSPNIIKRTDSETTSPLCGVP